MSIAMPTISRSPETLQKNRPLLAVINWELRRVRASKITWVTGGIAFCLFLFIAWTERTPITGGFGDSKGNWFKFAVAGTSAWGMTHMLAILIYIVVIFVSFVSADPMARDLKRGTYELVMTTKISLWAYAWGRYFAALLLCLGLAIAMLVAILCMGWFFYFQGPDYPAPQISTIVPLWAAVILPVTLFLSSIGFALGTWLPRHTWLPKVGIIIGCFFTSIIMQHSSDSLLTMGTNLYTPTT
jgi:ABC-type transport system involved in multi-copper enzyme maturation permease subunit